MATKSTPVVSVQYDEGTDQYRVGFKLGGTFVPVARVEGAYARGLAGQNTDPEDSTDDEGNGG